MARKGRDLEIKIKELEELGTFGIVVKSPDFIIDKVTGDKREVDVSIHGRVGSNEILIVMECRDQKSPQGIDWIEQIATKTKDIGANKLIAVSSSGFTENAHTKAAAYNIELRTLEEISLDKIAGLFNLNKIENNIYRNEIKEITFGLDLDENELIILKPKYLELVQKLSMTQNADKIPILIRKIDGKSISISDVWQGLQLRDVYIFYKGINIDEPKVTREIKIGVPKGEQGLQILLDGRLIDVLIIILKADLWIEQIITPISQFLLYKKDQEIIAKIHKFKIDQIGYNVEIRVR